MLVFDFGNTRVKVALFAENGSILQRWNFSGVEDEESAYALLQQYPSSPIAYIATGIIPFRIQEALNLRAAKAIHGGSELPFISRYETLKTIGADRLALLATAHAAEHSMAVLIIDAGTCITYDLLDQDGLHQGGLISPGLQMRLKAMHHFTSALPLCEVPIGLQIPGKNTTDAIAQGALAGFLAEIEGIISAFQNKFGALHIYISGGDAAKVLSEINLPMQHDPDMALKGIYTIALCQ